MKNNVHEAFKRLEEALMDSEGRYNVEIDPDDAETLIRWAIKKGYRPVLETEDKVELTIDGYKYFWQDGVALPRGTRGVVRQTFANDDYVRVVWEGTGMEEPEPVYMNLDEIRKVR